MERFGEKSDIYRKVIGLPPADSDDDPDSVGNEVGAHGFEEREEEDDNDDVDILEEEAMEIDTNVDKRVVRCVVMGRPLI